MNQLHFLSCDWGTSSFRLQLINRSSLQVVAQWKSEQGIKKTHREWSLQSATTHRSSFYRSYLKYAIGQLSTQTDLSLVETPIILSGMASSSIGLSELAYTKLPLLLSETALIHRWFEADDCLAHPLLLISGVEKEGDVMRGEEIQVMGCYRLHPLLAPAYTLILPGTHSKHLRIVEDRLVNFRTYMTGELFELMSQYSVLKSGLRQVEGDLSYTYRSVFLQALQQGLASNISSSLFSIRAKVLQKRLTPEEAGVYLSGLLIGLELKDLSDSCVVLGTSGRLFDLYNMALEHLRPPRLMIMSPEEVERWSMLGQAQFLEKQIS